METLRGRVTRARHTTHVSGNSSRVRTEHIAILEVGGVRVTYHSTAPVPIERGDEVLLVGRAGDGERTMDAVAYRNLSRDVEGDNLGGVGYTFALLFLFGVFLAPILIVPLFIGKPPLAAVREIVPEWLWMVAAVLLPLAVVADRVRRGERRRALALLDE